jgi:Protein of unknown function (DUF2465)
MFVII